MSSHFPGFALNGRAHGHGAAVLCVAGVLVVVGRDVVARRVVPGVGFVQGRVHFTLLHVSNLLAEILKVEQKNYENCIMDQ